MAQERGGTPAKAVAAGTPTPRPAQAAARLEPRALEPRALEPGALESGALASARAHLAAAAACGPHQREAYREHLREAIRLGLSPDESRTALRQLAVELQAIGDVSGACAAMAELVRVVPADPWVHHELSRLLARQGHAPERALFHAREAARLAPWNGELARWVRQLSGEGGALH